MTTYMVGKTWAQNLKSWSTFFFCGFERREVINLKKNLAVGGDNTWSVRALSHPLLLRTHFSTGKSDSEILTDLWSFLNVITVRVVMSELSAFFTENYRHATLQLLTTSCSDFVKQNTLFISITCNRLIIVGHNRELYKLTGKWKLLFALVGWWYSGPQNCIFCLHNLWLHWGQMFFSEQIFYCDLAILYSTISTFLLLSCICCFLDPTDS